MNEVETDRTSMTGRRTMKAMVQERYGPASEVLHLRDVAIPRSGRRGEMVRVHASSVNAMEWHLVNGKPYLMRVAFGLRPRNQTLGADVRSVIEDRFPLPDIALAPDRQGDFHARARTLIDVEGAF